MVSLRRLGACIDCPPPSLPGAFSFQPPGRASWGAAPGRAGLDRMGWVFGCTGVKERLFLSCEVGDGWVVRRSSGKIGEGRIGRGTSCVIHANLAFKAERG